MMKVASRSRETTTGEKAVWTRPYSLVVDGDCCAFQKQRQVHHEQRLQDHLYLTEQEWIDLGDSSSNNNNNNKMFNNHKKRVRVSNVVIPRSTASNTPATAPIAATVYRDAVVSPAPRLSVLESDDDDVKEERLRHNLQSHMEMEEYLKTRQHMFLGTTTARTTSTTSSIHSDPGAASDASTHKSSSVTQRGIQALENYYRRLQDLDDFIAAHGHCDVPQKYDKKPQLGIWVNKVRAEKKRYDAGHKTILTSEFIQELQNRKFCWCLTQKGHANWWNHYRDLVKYHRIHGHVSVHTKDKSLKSLGRWVSSQRSAYKKVLAGEATSTVLDQEKIDMLNELGFVWNAQTKPYNSTKHNQSRRKREKEKDAQDAWDEAEEIMADPVFGESAAAEDQTSTPSSKKKKAIASPDSSIGDTSGSVKIEMEASPEKDNIESWGVTL